MSFLLRTSSAYIVFLLLTCIACCLTARSASFTDVGKSTEQQCTFTQQPQHDDTAVFLQGGRVHVQRLSQNHIEEHNHQGESALLDQAFSLSPPMQAGDANTVTGSSQQDLKNSLFGVSSMKAIHERLARLFCVSSMPRFARLAVGLIIMMVLCMAVAACMSFLHVKDEPLALLRTNDMMMHTPETSGSRAGFASPHVGTPRMVAGPGSFLGMRVGSSPNSSNSPLMPPRSDQALPSKGQAQSVTRGAQLAMPGSQSLPPALCPSLVLPVCAARLGVPLNEIAQLASEGDLGIFNLSGTKLLRATVRRAGKRRSLEIAMPELSSAPRATVGPNPRNLHEPEDGKLEIRDFRGEFYGMLEMQSSGTCYVTRNTEITLTIDGDTDSLQLLVTSGGGHHLASVGISDSFQGDANYVEIRIEPGVDTVLVCACVLSVLTLSVRKSLHKNIQNL